MSFPVIFYEFTKKHNSTKLPTGGGTTYTCEFFGNFSMSTPTLIIKSGSDFINKYSYCRINLWNKYYFVDDYGYVDGHTTVTLSPDPMATYASEIKANQQYMLRSSDDHDDDIIDNAYPAKIYRGLNQINISNIFQRAGTYILAVAGAAGSKYYVVAYSGLQSLMAYMFNQKQDTLWKTIVSATVNDISKTFLNAFEYLRGCYWLPVAWDAPVDVEEIKLGYWSTGIVGGAAMPPQTKHFSITSLIPKNPNASMAKSFLSASPYTSYTLYIPFCGTYQLDASLLIDTSQISINMDVDCVGNIYGNVTNGTVTGNVILTFRGNCATELQLTQSGISLSRGPQSLSQIANGVVSADPINISSGIISAAELIRPEVTSVGGQGGYADIGNTDIIISRAYYDIVEPSDQPPGHPCCKTIAPTSGWYKCADAQVSWCKETFEYDMTKQIMDSGFWVE